MTTPSINKSVTYSNPTSVRTRTYQNGVLKSDSTTSSVATSGRLTQVRPKSSSVTIVKGWRDCKPWSHTKTEWEVRQTAVSRVVTSGIVRTESLFSGNGSFWFYTDPGLPPLPGANLINRAEVKALEALKNQHVNLGTFLGEGRQTIHMIAMTMNTIRKQVLRYRRSKPKDWIRVTNRQLGRVTLRNQAGKIPNSWLQLQYGWLPLLSDVLGMIEHVNQIDRGPLIHVEGKASGTDTRLIRLPTGYSGVWCDVPLDRRETVYVNLWYEVNLPTLVQVSQLGLLNPVEVCWELLPYSFVVDWFAAIGPWLSALTADAGFSFKGGSRSRLTREYGGRSGKPRIGSGQGVISGQPPSMWGEAFNFSRTCYTQSPVPGFYVKNPLSVKHVLNGLALLSQAFR